MRVAHPMPAGAPPGGPRRLGLRPGPAVVHLPGALVTPDMMVRRVRREDMTAPQFGSRQPKRLDARGLQPEISSFRLYLAAEGKAATTVRTYTEAVRWFAAASLTADAGRSRWEPDGKRSASRTFSGGWPGC